MADHFLNIGVAQRLGLKISANQVAKYATVPFSEAELEAAAASGWQYLVAMPEISLLELRKAGPSRFWDQDWYLKEAFAKLKSRPGYYLLGELPGSTDRIWSQQVAVQPAGFEVPQAVEMAYLAAARLADGAFPDWVRASDVGSDGDRVLVGVVESRVHVGGNWDSRRDSDLAVASGQFKPLVS